MKTQTRNQTKRVLGTAVAGLGALLAGNVKAQEATQDKSFGEKIDFRYRVDYLGNAEDSHQIRSTIGVAPEGSYGEGPISNKGQFFETFRAYDTWSTKGEDWSHFTALGARLPEFKLGDLKNNVLLFGSVGDIEGVGVETKHNYGPLSLILNAENRNDNDSRRLGAGLDWKVNESFKLGVGVDYVDGTSKTDQYLINGIWDVSKNDTVGLALLTKDLGDSQDYGIGGFWIHYGPEDKWGVRARAKVDWNEDNDWRNYNGEVIIAQRPRTSKPGATWIVGRSANADEMYNASVIPLSVSKTEATRLQDRAIEGLSFTARGNYLEQGDETSYSLGGGVGYNFPNTLLGGKLGIAGELDYSNTGLDDKMTFSPGVVYRKGNLELDLGIGVPVQGDGDVAARLGLQVRF